MSPKPLPLSSMVSDRLKAFRTTRGISGDALADDLTERGYRISRSTLANIENKRFKTVSVDLLDAVMEYFGVSYYAFFHGPLCNRCADDPPTAFICKVCGRTRNEAGELTKC